MDLLSKTCPECKFPIKNLSYIGCKCGRTRMIGLRHSTMGKINNYQIKTSRYLLIYDTLENSLSIHLLISKFATVLCFYGNHIPDLDFSSSDKIDEQIEILEMLL